MQKDEKKKILGYLFKKDLLVSPDFVSSLDLVEDEEDFFLRLKEKVEEDPSLDITSSLIKEIISSSQTSTHNDPSLKYDKEPKRYPVDIISNYDEESKKRDIPHFTSLFNARYKRLKDMLVNRPDLQNLVSINRIQGKEDRETLSIIGMIKSKEYTKNNNLILEIEDPTGEIKVIITKKNQEVFDLAKGMVLDEVVGICGFNGDNVLFANKIIFPDIPIQNELKKSPDECYAVFLADLHVGSKMFIQDRFLKFLEWINQRAGDTEQKDIASKVGYIFICGDLVDGVGIYPGQDEELNIKDIYDQYASCAEFLDKIPKHIRIIICPGNHDAMRIAEPQPAFTDLFAKPLLDLDNAVLVSNPSCVKIHSSPEFPGFNVLMYHGYSFDYYVANVESIRNNGGYENISELLSFLLQKRHLAPTHTSTLYIPETKKDPLIIEDVPDFFVTGHVHSSPSITNHRNVTLISSGCWQSITPFQEKVGHQPDPGKFPIINLMTRQPKILKF